MITIIPRVLYRRQVSQSQRTSLRNKKLVIFDRKNDDEEEGFDFRMFQDFISITTSNTTKYF